MATFSIGNGKLLSEAARQFATHAAINGLPKNTDLGYVVGNAYEFTENVRVIAFAQRVNDAAKNSAFSLFLDAAADAAEKNANVVANGGNLTGYFKDMVDGDLAVKSTLFNATNDHINSLEVASVNWTDPASKQALWDRIIQTAQGTTLRDHLGYVDGQSELSIRELSILLHASNKAEYTEYINAFEDKIRGHFQSELENSQNIARSLGYKGKLSDVKSLQTFADTLSGSQKAAVLQLIDMTNGKVNKVDQYILARIRNNNIDVNEILSTGQFNGMKLDEESRAIFAALNVYAHSDAIATQYFDDTLKALDPSFMPKASADFNNYKDVAKYVKSYEGALAKAGYGYFDPKTFQVASRGGGGSVPRPIKLDKLTLKQLRQIQLPKGIDANTAKAMTQYITLREHAETLQVSRQMTSNMRMRLVSLSRKILGDSDLSESIGQLQKTYHHAKFAMKIWFKTAGIRARITAPVHRWMRRRVANAALRNQRILQRVLGRRYNAYANSAFGPNGRAQARARREAAQKAKQAAKEAQKAAQAATKAQSRSGIKHATKAAKQTQKKLLAKAGRSASKGARWAGRFASHGITHGSVAAGSSAAVTSSAAAGAGGTAAGTAAGSTAAAGGTAAASGTAAAGGIGVLGVCGIVIIVIIVVGMLAQVAGFVIQGIAQSVMSLSDTLLVKMIDWIAENFHWPWEATDEDRQNLLTFTLYDLMDADAQAKKIENVLTDYTFHGGFCPSDSTDAKSVSWSAPQHTSDTVSEQSTVYYAYKNALTGAPINEYNNVKLCLSMAHAFTAPIEDKSQLEKFSFYASGLWRYLNHIDVSASLTMCQGDGTFTWHCSTPSTANDSAFYSKLNASNVSTSKIRIYSPGDKINISNNNSSYLYVVGGAQHLIAQGNHHAAAPNRSGVGGCISWTHDNKTGKTTYASADSAIQASMPTTKALTTFKALGGFTSWKRTVNAYRINNKGDFLTYDVNPSVVSECVNGRGFALTNANITYCPTAIDTAQCGNCASFPIYELAGQKYCNDIDGAGSVTLHTGTETKTVGLCTSNKRCANGKWEHTGKQTIYICKGHATPTICYGFGTLTYYKRIVDVNGTPTYFERSTPSGAWTPGQCNNYTTIEVAASEYGPLRTLYICQGHTNHGAFTGDSQFFSSCREKVYYDTNHPTWFYLVEGFDTKECYVCNGYDYYAPNGHTAYACQGHYICTEQGTNHHTCPGHTITYCEGHVDYVITRSIISSDEDAIYSDEWTYEVNDNFLWWDTSAIYTPKKEAPDGQESLARGDWGGWVEENVEAMHAMFASDWYRQYELGLGSFIGAECSPYERYKIKETFNINEENTSDMLMQNLDCALDACGKVCYYPNDRSYYAGMDDRNKFNTTAPAIWDKNHVQRGVHGLDPKYFAEWVYRSTHNGSTISQLSTAFDNNTRAVRSNTPAGTPIVYRQGEEVKTGILIGTFSDGFGNMYIRYVGLDTGTKTGGGWVTILTDSPDGWYYHPTAQK